jgi:hypothetical protein
MTLMMWALGFQLVINVVLIFIIWKMDQEIDSLKLELEQFITRSYYGR